MDTEGRLERYRGADRWPTEESLAAMLDAQQSAFAAVRTALPGSASGGEGGGGASAREGQVDLCRRGRFRAPGGAGRRRIVADLRLAQDRLLYLIAGGDEALVRSKEGAEDDGEGAAAQIAQHRIGSADVVIGIAASDPPPIRAVP